LTLGRAMSEPVDRFCDVLGGFNSGVVKELIAFCCGNLGREAKLAANPVSEDFSFEDYLREFTLDDLREHMNMLVERVGIDPEFLIRSLFHSLIEHFDKLSDPITTGESIDFYLGRLAKLQEELKQPRDTRRDHIRDDQLRGVIAFVKRALSSKVARRQNAVLISEKLRTEWGRQFSAGYWKDWERRSLRPH
jgi:hypothetical protein